MGDVFVSLLPVIAGATLVPVYPIVVLLLLQSQRGLGKAMAFVAGAVAVRLVQGILFGFVFGAAAEAYPDGGSEVIASTLLLIMGILLLIGAYKKWRKEADPDEHPVVARPGRPHGDSPGPAQVKRGDLRQLVPTRVGKRPRAMSVP